MTVKETLSSPKVVQPRPNVLSYATLFNVIGWGILFLLVWLVVKPAATKGSWSSFADGSTWLFLLDGVWLTLQVAFYSVFLSLLIGIVLALGRLSTNRFVKLLSVGYIELIRALPAVLIIFYVFIGMPKLGIKLDAIWFAVIGLTIFTSAVLAEVVRAGILSIEKGQLEAAYSLGMPSYRTLIHIVLPQALRRMAPAIVSQLITLTKDTSLAGIIALQELTRKGQQLYQFNGNILETMFVVAVIYFIICYALSFVSSRLEVRKTR